MEKNILLAYLLWAAGGFLGLHHFYLRRDGQAFFWWCTMGGCGFGWLRDFFRLPSYVKDANDDVKFVAQLAETMKKHDTPPFTYSRFLGQLVLGYLFSFAVYSAVPEEEFFGFSFDWLAYLLAPVGAAVGVYIVGNIGREMGNFKAALLGAFLGVFFFSSESKNIVMASSLSASCLFTFKARKWRRSPRPRKPVWKRATILAGCGMIYLSLWASCFYFNATLTYSDGETVKLRDAMQHFLDSPLWKEFKQTLHVIYLNAQRNGWESVWQEMIESIDPLGEQNALYVLGLSPGASQEEVTSQYRKLSRQYHPDRFQDETAKKEAQEKFLGIQEAYERLSSLKARRRRKAQSDFKD